MDVCDAAIAIDAPGIRRCLESHDGPGQHRVKLTAGSTLTHDVQEGQKVIHILLSGLCLVEWTSETGRRRIIDLLCPGDILDLSAIPPFPGLSVHSLQSSVMLEVGSDQLDKDDARSHRLVDVAFAFFDQYQRKQAMLATMLGSLNAEQRVAALFIDLANRLGDPGVRTHAGFQIPLTRRDIADHLALNADTLSRILSRFKSEGLLQQIGRDKIYIQDWAALLEFCPLTTVLLADRYKAAKSLCAPCK